jgi:hypothetical protein
MKEGGKNTSETHIAVEFGQLSGGQLGGVLTAI